jgi:pimeloyl-ACP methyl ester carboxylesterase
MDRGDGNVTEPVVMIPGLMCDARSMLPQLLALGPQFSVQVFLAAQGQAVEQMSEAALALAPARFALIGHGLGGAVALDMIRRAGDRITRVVLIAADPLPEEPKVAAAREARMVAARAGRLGQIMAEEIPESSLAEGPDRASVMALQRDMALDLGEGVFLRQSRAMQRRPDQQKTLRRATMPVLLIAGAADRLVPPRRTEFMASLMPRAQVCIIDAAGHLPTVESPDAVNAAILPFLEAPLLLR